MKITVLGRIPSKKNNKSALVIRGRAIIITNGKHKKWENDAKRQVLPQVQGMPLPHVPTGRVEFHFYAPDKRRTDLSNKWESVADMLVEAGILEDDNTDILFEILLKFCGVDRENPRAELLL